MANFSLRHEKGRAGPHAAHGNSRTRSRRKGKPEIVLAAKRTVTPGDRRMAVERVEPLPKKRMAARPPMDQYTADGERDEQAERAPEEETA